MDAPVAASAEDTPSDENPSAPTTTGTATTTAGEAATQKQSKDKDSSTVSPNPFGATVAPGGVTAQQQAHAHWQAHMMYHQQQFYHQQLQMQNQQAFPPLTIPQPTPVLPPSTIKTDVSLNDEDLEPAPVSAMENDHIASSSDDEEGDKKRQRVEI